MPLIQASISTQQKRNIFAKIGLQVNFLKTAWFDNFFPIMRFNPVKTGHQLQDMELQEEEKTDKKNIGKIIKKQPQVKGAK